MRTSLALAAAAFIALAAFGRAQASTEFCPAEAGTLHQVGGSGSRLFSYVLTARSARTVQGDVVAQAPQGWFTFAFPPVALTERTRNYDTGSLKFSRTTFESARMYVTFPPGAIPGDAFVSAAAASNDAAFGWDAKGTVGCLASAGFGLHPPGKPQSGPTSLDPPEDLDAPPPPGTHVATAAITSAPGRLDCAQPFTQARTKHVVTPRYPRPLARAFSGSTTSLIRIVIGADGVPADAYVWQPSVAAEFDQAALEAAMQSTYSPGTSFCAPAPGAYIFHAEFRNP